MAASSSNYRILMEARINKAASEAGIRTDLSAISQNQKLLLGLQFNPKDIDQLKQKLLEIDTAAQGLGKVKIFSDDKGNIGKAIYTFTDGVGKSAEKVITLNSKLETSVVSTQNLTRETNAYNKALLDSQKQTARQADEMARIANTADAFLARAKNLNQTPSVQAARGIAEQIKKVAYSEGNLDKMRELNNQLGIQKAALTTGRTALENFTEGMKRSIATTVQYALSVGALHFAMNQLRQGIQHITDLNKEMTNIQLVTGQSDAEVAKLAQSYGELGKELSVSTIEIAKGSLEFIRQGKSAEETEILLRNSIKMAKLGNMEAADSTERLTSIMNGFKLAASDTASVIDKLIGLDNAYATSVNEISTAMKYSSNSAQQAGVDFEHLAAYITVVSSVTRMSSETIGQAMKTMLTRFTDIKAGKIDEDGLGINNVESALARVNISLRDSKNSFRDIQDVIDDLGEKWETLTEVEQNNIAKAVAGVRQKEQFLVLMNNQVKIQEALNVQSKSQGLMDERYEIFLNNIEAAQGRLLVAWQTLASSTATKDFIISLIDAVTGVLNLVNALGGIPAILNVIIPLLVVFKAEWLAIKAASLAGMLETAGSAILSLAGSFTATNTAMAETIILEGGVAAGLDTIAASQAAATLGISLLIMGLVKLGIEINKLDKQQDEIIEKRKKNDEELANSAKTYEEYVRQAREAAGAGIKYDDKGNAYRERGRGMKEYIKDMKLLTEAEWEAQQAVKATNETLGDAPDSPDGTYNPVPEVTDESKKALEEIRNMVVDMIKQKKKAEIDFIKDELKVFKDYIEKQKQAYKDVYEAEKKIREEKKIAIERELEDNRRVVDERKKSVDQELDDYRRVIDAQRELLREKERAADYDKNRKEDQKELAKLESEIALLALDDSAEAIAQRLQLEEEASNLRTKMEEEASDETLRLQEVALDNELRVAEERNLIRNREIEEEVRVVEERRDMRLRDLEDEQRAADEAYDIQIRRLDDEYDAREQAMQAKIDQIEKYLEQEGTIVNDAMNMILNKNAETYQALLEWNKVYGTGINEDVVTAWGLAQAALDEYKKSLAGLTAPSPSSSVRDNAGDDYFQRHREQSGTGGYHYDPNKTYTNPTGRHSGVDTGFVGGKPLLKSNEEFAKLLSGELVVNSSQMSQFMNRTLPQMVQNNNNGGNIEINMPLQVAGSLDRSCLPDIESIVKKAVRQLNDSLSQRGFTRRAEAFSTG